MAQCLTRELSPPCQPLRHPNGKGQMALMERYFDILALIMMTRVDWKRVGLAAGSNTDALDWNDWNNPLISRLNAKLLRNRTYPPSEGSHGPGQSLTYEIRYRGIE